MWLIRLYLLNNFMLHYLELDRLTNSFLVVTQLDENKMQIIAEKY